MRGQALVEFALISPILFFLLALSIDVYRVDWVSSTVAEAARQGARQAVANEDPPDNAFGASAGLCSGITQTPSATGSGCLKTSRIFETVTSVLGIFSRSTTLTEATAAACPNPAVGSASVCVYPFEQGPAGTYASCDAARTALGRDPVAGELGSRSAEYANPQYKGCFEVRRDGYLPLRHPGSVPRERGAWIPEDQLIHHDAGGILMSSSRLKSARLQSGQAIVIVGAMLIVLTILGAMVFDVGLAMSDRRNIQAYSDSAALAGARSYSQGVNKAHWVAMQYVGSSLNFPLPTGACAGPASCPAGTYSVAGFQISLSDSFRVGGILNYPTVLDVVITHQQPSVFARMIGYSTVKTGASARATPPGPEIQNSAYAVAAVDGNALINGGGAAFQTVGGPVYAYGSFGANDVPHSTGVPTLQTNYDGTTCPGGPANRVDNGGGTNGLDYHTTDGGTMATSFGVPPNFSFDHAVPTLAQPTPTYFSAAAALDGLGNWKPGIYNGFAPNGGTMNGGVYKIINSANLTLGAITNTVHTPSGTSNGANAVAIVIDSSDTGALDITQAVLNGLDDLYPPTYSGVRDPAGTHNFVIFGGHGPGAYTAGITIGPGATTDMSGIIYTPDSPYVSNGNSSPQFTGSVVVKTMTVTGGGNGAQVFHWVCGLNAIGGRAFGGGLVR